MAEHSELLDVVKVSARGDYPLLVEFENGEKRVFDMTLYRRRMPFARLTGDLFAQATVAYGTVVWPSEIDISPETLYEPSRPLTESIDG